ncbi:MAG: type II secretion system F family protein [Lentisphaerae bacterium]|nr:type II secretion system F family protein [Lentisphaerota bacterium]
MKTFEYKGFNASGQVQKGLMEAMDVKNAREKLARQGVLAEWVGAAGDSAASPWSRPRRFGLLQRSILYRELAALLRAGFPLVHALDVLIQSPEMTAFQANLANIRDQLREGASLADAFAHAIPELLAYEKSAIQAGERAAVLDTLLERLASFLDEQHRLRERIVSALIYPAIIVTVAIAIGVGLMSFTVPRIAAMIEQSHRAATLPFLTQAMLSAGRFLKIAGLPILALGIAGVLIVRRRVRRNPDFRTSVSAKLFRIPVWGRASLLLANLRFARTLALLLNAGIPLIESFTMAGQATGNAWIQELVRKEAETIRHGGTLAEALRRIPPFANTLAGWMRVGEASGSLEHLLDNAGNLYQQQWERFITRFLTILEPVLILIAGLFVLLIVLAILIPILSMNQWLK